MVAERIPGLDVTVNARRWAAALIAGGVTARDRVLVALTPDWAIGADCWAALGEIGAAARYSVPVTVGDVVEFAPSVLISTPTDALGLIRAATEQHVDLSSGLPRLVVVTGEPGGSIRSTRRCIEESLEARCLDVYALREVGVVGWTCSARPESVHLDEGAFGVECDAAAGGELVLSGLRTGDVVRLGRAACGCGRTDVRAQGGILGRLSEQMLVGGVELLPSGIEEVVRRHPAVADYHVLVYAVRGASDVVVQIETDSAIASEGDQARVAAEVSEDLKRSLGLRLECEVVVPGSLSKHHAAGRRARRLSRQ